MDVQMNMLVKQYEMIVKNSIKNGEIHKNADGIYKKSIKMDLFGNRIAARGKDPYSIAVKLANNHIKYYKKHNVDKNKLLYSDILDEFFEVEIENCDITEKVKKDYKAILENHIKKGFGTLRIGELNYKDFQSFLNNYYGYGESLVKKIRMLLILSIKYAKKCGYYDGSVDLGFKLPKTEPLMARNTFDDEELAAIIYTCKKHYAGSMFLVMLLCGMRPKELCQLEWSDINFEEKYLHIKKSKTESGIRDIPLCPTAIKELLKRKEYCENNDISSPYVFTLNTKEDTPYTTDRIKRVFNNLLRDMNIEFGAEVYRNKIEKYVFDENLTPYQFRHTFCSNLKLSGVNDFYIKKVMGHSLKSDITFFVYTHIDSKMVYENCKCYFDYIEKKLVQWNEMAINRLNSIKK